MAKSDEVPTGTAQEGADDISADICVIGAGPSGIAVATAAAAFGRSVVMAERQQVGGAALHHGALAARSLAAAANRAYGMQTAAMFGIAGRDPDLDMRTVNAYVESTLAEAAPNFAAERFVGLGIRVVHAAGRFINKKTVVAGEHRIRARRFVIATGSVPAVPSIPGLEAVPYFTTETIFVNQERLHNLIVIGGGAQGLEFAQTFSRLGSRVMVLDEGRALAEEDPELAKCVLAQFAEEGIAVYENTKVQSIEGGLGRVRINVTVDGEKHVVEGSHLLLATGHKPATSDLGLEAAGIRHDEHGIKVNAGLKTTNRRVFAVGRVAAGSAGARAADYQAGVVVRRALLHMRARADAHLVPRAVFTDPELASVGLGEAEAAKASKKYHVLRWPYRENDRAMADRTLAGHVKVITDGRGTILGAGIVGAQASELIAMWSLAVSQGSNIRSMAGWVPAYPTLSAINKSVASGYYAARTSSPTLRKVIDFLAKLG